MKAMAAGEFDPRAWWDPGSWTVESWAEAFERSPAFGRRFLSEVARRFPLFQADAVCLRWAVQPDDVYAVFPVGGDGVGIQVDPDLEHVIVWGRNASAEFGDWGEDFVLQAVEYLAGLPVMVNGGSESPGRA
jgi:hypothetical protein